MCLVSSLVKEGFLSLGILGLASLHFGHQADDLVVDFLPGLDGDGEVHVRAAWKDFVVNDVRQNVFEVLSVGDDGRGVGVAHEDGRLG